MMCNVCVIKGVGPKLSKEGPFKIHKKERREAFFTQPNYGLAISIINGRKPPQAQMSGKVNPACCSLKSFSSVSPCALS